MVMKVHTGVPGAGKTYFLIKSYTDLFCQYDSDSQRFELRPEHRDKVLVSNIQDLTLEHLDLDSLISDRCETLARARWFENPKAKDIGEMDDVISQFYSEFHAERVRWFFSADYQESLAKIHGPLIYLIEESQRYFDSKELGRQAWVRDVLYFFERHRHLGFSILCDTQHISKIHKGIAVLFEVEVQAKPRTLSLIGEFKYNEITDGVKTNQLPIVVKPDQRIFKVYKSMDVAESIKPKKPAVKLAFMIVFLILGAFGLFTFFISKFGAGDVIAADGVRTASGSASDPVHEVQVMGNAEQGKRLYGSSPVDTIKTAAEWVRLSYILWTDQKTGQTEIRVVHPLTNTITPLLEITLPVKRVGDGIFADISSGI